MIRDPSDGSVREKTTWEEEVVEDAMRTAVELINLTCRQATERMGLPPLPEDKLASGLPTGSTKPENLARLERSRRQLENYRKTGSFQSTAEVAEPECDHLTTEKSENG